MACLERQFNYIRGFTWGAKQERSTPQSCHVGGCVGSPDAGIVESAVPGATVVPKFPADLLTGQFCSLPESRASDSRDADRDSPSRLPVTARFGGSFRLRGSTPLTCSARWRRSPGRRGHRSPAR